MNTYRIAFVGHDEIKDQLRLIGQIQKIIQERLRQKEFVELYTGRNSDFGFAAMVATKGAQKTVEKHNSRLVLLQPYPTENGSCYERLCDEVRYCANERIDPVTAITELNHWMIDRADLLVAYVEADRADSAMSAFEYAQKRGIPIINLAEQEQ
jgi:hypothetical protein